MFQNIKKTDQKELTTPQIIQIAKTANQCERFRDMSDAMCEVIIRGMKPEYNIQEIHNMVTIAFKNSINNHREAIQSIWRIIIQENENIRWEENCLNQMKHINHEKNLICKEFIDALKLAIETVDSEDQYTLSFYWKTIGDQQRQMCEPFKKVEFDLTLRDIDQLELENYLIYATDSYKKAMSCSKFLKNKDNPLYQGIRLNQSVFVHDYIQDTETALKIVNECIHETSDVEAKMKETDELGGILSVMYENLKLWNSGDINHLE